MDKSNLSYWMSAALLMLSLESTAVAWVGRGESRAPSGPTLEYSVATPTIGAPQIRQKYPVWILQPGDGAPTLNFNRFSRSSLAHLLSLKYKVAVVWPEMRREKLKSDLKKYCELDFFHRIDDLQAVVDQVRKIPFIDKNKIILVGNSGGSEIVTLTANRRSDIAAVATIGGGLLQYMDYLKEVGDTEWTKASLSNSCVEGHYKERSSLFWRQFLYSGLFEEIKRTPMPYLMILGSKDEVTSHEVTERYIPQVTSVKKNFEYLLVDGMKHSFGLRQEPWQAIRDLTARL